jgi:SAM-dependent methyltransferase
MPLESSDGAVVEAEIGQLLARSTRLGADDAPGAERYDASWSVAYHLAPERANLLRHLDFSGLDVLELGAGMGGLSRFLSESAERLEVVEGSEARLAALARRLRDRTNWSGRAGRVAELAPTRRHDVVCVVGGRECAEPGGSSPGRSAGPALAGFLDHAVRALRDDGVLLLAIPNRFGLKYWSGAAADHSGRLYDGICGDPPDTAPRAFSLPALRGLLEGAGFASLDEYFPFPDHHLPASVLTRRFVDAYPQAAAALAIDRAVGNHGRPRVRQFPERLAAEGLAAADLLRPLANAFFLLASRRADSATRRRLRRREIAGEIAWHYACRRRVPTRTVFAERDGAVTTRKEPLRASDPREVAFADGDLQVRWRAGDGEPLVGGTSLRSSFARYAYFGDAAGCLAIVDDFVRRSFARWKDGDELAGGALDAILTNAMAPFTLFDLEWTVAGTMPRSWFVLRNVVALLADRELFPREPPFRSGAELYAALCRRHRVVPRLADDVLLEARLQALMTDRPSVATHRQELDAALAAPILGTLHPRVPTDEERLFLALLPSRPFRALSRLIGAARTRPWLGTAAKRALRLTRVVR